MASPISKRNQKKQKKRLRNNRSLFFFLRVGLESAGASETTAHSAAHWHTAAEAATTVATTATAAHWHTAHHAAHAAHHAST